MKTFKKITAFLLLLFFSGGIFAQEMHQAQMAEGFYKEGKIYVVIGVLSIVLIGVLVYLFTMDKKLKNLEDQLKNKNE